MRRNIGESGGKVTKKYPASRLVCPKITSRRAEAVFSSRDPRACPVSVLPGGFTTSSTTTIYRGWDVIKCIAVKLQSIAGFFVSRVAAVVRLQ